MVSGIDELITACLECYRTFFAHDYPANSINLDFKVTHLYEFMENEIDKAAVTFDGPKGRFTYQDSCRLNGLEEMQDIKEAAICCGNSAWTGCDAYSKAFQVKRINQAKKIGSDFIITACPKCRINLGCAMEDPFEGGKLKIELTDLTNIIAEHICWE